MLKAFTIDSYYLLDTYDSNNTQYTLASIDGSVASYYNLDAIEFAQEGYNTDIMQSPISMQKTADTTITIYYHNYGEPNSAITMSITRLDTNELVYSSSTFADKDEITILYDWSTLSGVNATNTFKGVATAVNAGGTTTNTVYFNSEANTGLIPAGLALAISIILAVFGLTFASIRTTFSWFGIFIMLISIGILSFAVAAWYVTFLMAVELVILLYIIITMVTINQSSISG
jgi:hypothetical protein